jgi:iron complex outermembrane receptor protein
MKIDQWVTRGKISYDFGKVTLTYTGGYRNVDITGCQPLNGFVPETFSFDNKLAYQT